MDISVGEIFGEWTVLGRANVTYKNKKNNIYWDCRCSCGNICHVKGSALRQGLSSRCKKCSSAATGKKNKVNDFHVASGTVLQQYKRNAKSRGLVFALTKDELKTLIVKDCFYCGAPPSNTVKTFSGRPGVHRAVMYNGIDRIDSSKDYILENCVTCCFICNWAKANMSVEQFRTWIKKVYIHQFKKTTDMTPGQLIDSLFTTDYKCWWAQEKIMDMSLSEEERLKAAIQAQEYNAKRTKLIRTIDELLDFSENTNTEKTYSKNENTAHYSMKTYGTDNNSASSHKTSE